MKKAIQISEVGPRDGLQSISELMPLEHKKRWIEAQFNAGTSEIEVGSFVPARVLPQMADTPELTKYAAALDGLTVAVLAPNLHGVKAAVECGVLIKSQFRFR